MRQCLLALIALCNFPVGCASESSDAGDGDADADADADGGTPRECPTTEEPVTCDLDGLDAAPELLEPGCGIQTHSLRWTAVIADEGQNLDRRIAEPSLTLAISPENQETFPISPEVQAVVNGCELPHDPAVSYSWVMDAEAMNLTLTPGKHYVFEVREVGAVGEARIFFRQDLVLPTVLPEILTPAMDEALPDPAVERDARVDVTWNPFEVSEATWAVTHSIDLHGWLLGGSRPPFKDEFSIVDNIDGSSGTARFNTGAFSDWDWIVLITRLSNASDSLAIHVARHVN